jgi:hypothetical protein
MRKCANISPYMRRPLVKYDFATALFWISLYYMRKILFSFLSVWSHWTVQRRMVPSSLAVVVVPAACRLAAHATAQSCGRLPTSSPWCRSIMTPRPGCVVYTCSFVTWNRFHCTVQTCHTRNRFRGAYANLCLLMPTYAFWA